MLYVLSPARGLHQSCRFRGWSQIGGRQALWAGGRGELWREQLEAEAASLSAQTADPPADKQLGLK